VALRIDKPEMNWDENGWNQTKIILINVSSTFCLKMSDRFEKNYK
jgi:hypothetical protein